MWLGLGFTFNPTAFFVLVAYPFQTTTLRISPQNNNFPVLPPLPLPSQLTPEENSLHVLPPMRIYRKMLLSSIFTETPFSIHTDILSISSQISNKNYTSSSQLIFCGRNLLFPQLRSFWWEIQVLQ